MALIKCPECGKEVSDKAKQCPHCGMALVKVNIILMLVIILSIIATIMVGILGYICYNNQKYNNNGIENTLSSSIEPLYSADKNETSLYTNATQTPNLPLENNKYIGKIYYDYIKNMRVLMSYSHILTTEDKHMAYPVNDLWFYIDDINYDGIIDCVVTDEKTEGNGLKIYTYKNNLVQMLYESEMPYSAGNEIKTLAMYNGQYGVFYHRYNSSDEFTFRSIDKNGNDIVDLRGAHIPDNWSINDENLGEEKWEMEFNSIKPVTFYEFKDFQTSFSGLDMDFYYEQINEGALDFAHNFFEEEFIMRTNEPGYMNGVYWFNLPLKYNSVDLNHHYWGCIVTYNPVSETYAMHESCEYLLEKNTERIR